MEINILDYIKEENIVLNLKVKGKKKVISLLLDHLVEIKKIKRSDKKAILKTLLQREEMGSTAIGGGIALPHARVDCVKNMVVCVGISKEGVNFDSLDGDLVNIVTLLLSNQKETGLHLKMLAYLARMLRDKYFVRQLKSASDKEEVLSAIKKQASFLK